MIITSEDLKPGLPKINEQPLCALCKTAKAFLVEQTLGIVCGKCWMEWDKEHKETIILEQAEQIKIKRGIKI